MDFHVEVNFSSFPSFAGFLEQGRDEPEQGGLIEEEAGDAGAAFKFWLTRSSALEMHRSF